MKKKLGITKGQWKYEGGDNHSIDIILDDESTITIDRQSRYTGEYIISRKGMKSNAKLISDAGNTANKCNKLPSEILKERDDLIKEVKNLRNTLKMYLPVELYSELHSYYTSEKLIQSIEKE